MHKTDDKSEMSSCEQSEIDLNVNVNEVEVTDKSEWGTFKDSLKSPVHNWFTYPAGFSYKAVQHCIETYGLRAGTSVIYDPFMGSGTTNLTAKTMGINSVGVEAHPFVFRIAQCKMNWDIDSAKIVQFISDIDSDYKVINENDMIGELTKEFPELIMKCFLPSTLYELLHTRNRINSSGLDIEHQNFLITALIGTLRVVSIAATGWPYIAPKKIKVTSLSRKGFGTYKNHVLQMLDDIAKIRKTSCLINSNHSLICGDSRDTTSCIDNESIDLIFTSPPYLNNFDYADRTRLEMYFTGEAKNWGDLSTKIRSKLMTSATTQINRSDSKYVFHRGLIDECPDVYEFLANAVHELSQKRLTKGGKKSYDLMVIGYFNDMYRILKENYRVLKTGSTASYVLGDSAPYGVHIPTDIVIGNIGKYIGFSDYEIKVLRTRGGKWAANPQRHSVMLRDTIVVLKK